MTSDEIAEPSPTDHESWGLAEGDPIVPGLLALGPLGGGHDFEVVLGWDEHRHSLVVVKLVRPHLVNDDHVLGALARESGLVHHLSHPVIVRGFGSAPDGPRPHLVLEHLEGPTVSATVLRTGPLALHQLVPLAYQLASALQYLANERVAHLDVKPGNVILGAPPRLVDLSIARSLDDAASIRRPLGTDRYMAPEQCVPEGAPIGTAADVWGLGATLYEAASGRPPFPRPEGFDPHLAEERFPQLLGFPPEPLGDLPAELGEIVMDCLRLEPPARPPAGEVADRLEPLIGAMHRGRVLGHARPRLR